MDIRSHKNTGWYPYPDFGSFFSLRDGVLFQSAMLASGEMDNSIAEVDWDRGVAEENRVRLREIADELQQKE